MIRYITKKYLLTFISTLVFLSFYSNASVVINATRIIYPEKETEVTVILTNKGQSPVLVQNWLDDGDINASPERIDVPFIIAPPINRIDPGKSQTLRISYSGGALPSDRESIFWLNILEIPQTKPGASPNRLQVAFRSRIKLFYRPSELIKDPTEAADALSWSINNGVLTAKNDSAFFISLMSTTLINSDKKMIIDGEMIAPFSSHDFSLKNNALLKGDKVSYDYINDWGAVKTKKKTL